MSLLPRSRRLLVLAATLAIALAAWAARARVEHWTRAELAQRHQQQLAQLSEEGAAALIERLAAADDEFLDLVVLALDDPRPRVASAAIRALQARVDCWGRWPQEQSGPRVAALAELLAPLARQLPTDRRAPAQTIATRLMAFPVNGRQVDSARLIANCETILRLQVPPSVPDEDRIAFQPRAHEPQTKPIELPAAGLPAAPPLPLAVQPAPSPPVDHSPAIDHPRQPEPLPDASRERPSEPRQFIAPKAIRISDE
jgi:hypothetical protein